MDAMENYFCPSNCFNGIVFYYTISSVQFSRSVMSDSLRPHKSRQARPPCPSPTPGVYSDSYPSSWWCHPTHLILCHPLLLLPPIPPSIRVFSDESTLCMRWPGYWSFSLSISPSNELDHQIAHIQMNARIFLCIELTAVLALIVSYSWKIWYLIWAL